MLDTLNSYFTLMLRTNAYTAAMVSGVQSLIRSMTIRLPSNGNIILEQIDSNNKLASIVQMINFDKTQLDSKWASLDHCAIDPKRAESLKRARRCLNLNANCDAWKTVWSVFN
jgi:hypothetical protein